MVLKFGNLKKSIDALDRALQILASPTIMDIVDLPTQETLRAGAIQNFEVAYEQCWKAMKRWLEKNFNAVQVDGVTRRELFRIAAEHVLIEDVDHWMSFHQARNETSHTYDGSVAIEVLRIAEVFLAPAKKLLHYLEMHND